MVECMLEKINKFKNKSKFFTVLPVLDGITELQNIDCCVFLLNLKLSSGTKNHSEWCLNFTFKTNNKSYLCRRMCILTKTKNI